jgi:hypothetical protein
MSHGPDAVRRGYPGTSPNPVPCAPQPEAFGGRDEMRWSRDVSAKSFTHQHVLQRVVTVPCQRRRFNRRMRGKAFRQITFHVGLAGHRYIPHHTQRLHPTARHRCAFGGHRPSPPAPRPPTTPSAPPAVPTDSGHRCGTRLFPHHQHLADPLFERLDPLAHSRRRHVQPQRGRVELPSSINAAAAASQLLLSVVIPRGD